MYRLCRQACGHYTYLWIEHCTPAPLKRAHRELREKTPWYIVPPGLIRDDSQDMWSHKLCSSYYVHFTFTHMIPLYQMHSSPAATTVIVVVCSHYHRAISINTYLRNLTDGWRSLDECEAADREQQRRRLEAGHALLALRYGTGYNIEAPSQLDGGDLEHMA